MSFPEPIVLSVDSSTTATKAIAWDAEGNALTESRVPMETSSPQPGWCEQRAGEWYSALIKSIRGVLEHIPARYVRALAITHQRESFVPLDERLDLLYPAILWMDERGKSYLPDWEEMLGVSDYASVTGKVPDLSLSLPKIIWLRENRPEIWKRTDKILDVFSYLCLRLTGRAVTSWASADPLGLLDMRSLSWSDEILRAAQLHSEQLPDLCPPGSVVGYLTTEAASDTGLTESTPLVATGGDGQCAALGVSASSPGVAALNLGTAVVSDLFSENYVVSRAFRTLCACIPGKYMPEGVIRGGTATIDWFLKTWLGSDHPKGEGLSGLEDAASKIGPGTNPLITIPYWHGSNSPYWDANAKGVTIGWCDAVTPAHIYRSILEGIAFEQKLILENMAEATGDIVCEVRIHGGGARSSLWCQIISDVLGCTVISPTSPENTSLGAAMLGIAAVEGIGIKEASENMYHVQDRYEPSEASLRYEKLYKKVYKPLFPGGSWASCRS